MFLWNGPWPFVSSLLTARFQETEGPSVLIPHLKVLFCIVHRRIPLTSLIQKSMASPRLLNTPLMNEYSICRKCCNGHTDSTLAKGFLSHLHAERDKRRGIVSAESIEMSAYYMQNRNILPPPGKTRPSLWKQRDEYTSFCSWKVN